MNDIILVGSGGHAKSCIDVINHTGLYKVAGLVEKNIKKKINNLGFPIIGTDKDLKRSRQKFDYALITVGQINSAEIRLRLFEKLCDLDYKLPVIISPRSHISQYAEIGEGTIIMHDVILNASSKIGKNCIINNKVLIEHDATIGNSCHIATGAIINGGVKVGDKTFIGSGVVTKQGISIGSHSLVGAGVVLKNNVKSNKVVKS